MKLVDFNISMCVRLINNTLDILAKDIEGINDSDTTEIKREILEKALISLESEPEKQSVPYTLEEMRKWNSSCKFFADCKIAQIDSLDCHVCFEGSLRFDFCGICAFQKSGVGYVKTPENDFLYIIKEMPFQIDSDTWIIVASCDVVTETVDDRDWCLVFNEEDRRWHNYGLIRVTDKMFCCPNCQCQYVYEYDLTKSTPYECFQCKLRFSF